jgi:hypothetical protein
MPHTEVNICVAVVAGDELPVVGVSVAHYLVHPGNYYRNRCLLRFYDLPQFDVIRNGGLVCPSTLNILPYSLFSQELLDNMVYLSNLGSRQQSALFPLFYLDG